MIESGVNPQALAVWSRFPMRFPHTHAISGCNPRIEERERRASIVVAIYYTRCIAYLVALYVPNDRGHALERRQPRSTAA